MCLPLFEFITCHLRFSDAELFLSIRGQITFMRDPLSSTCAEPGNLTWVLVFCPFIVSVLFFYNAFCKVPLLVTPPFLLSPAHSMNPALLPDCLVCFVFSFWKEKQFRWCFHCWTQSYQSMLNVGDICSKIWLWRFKYPKAFQISFSGTWMKVQIRKSYFILELNDRKFNYVSSLYFRAWCYFCPFNVTARDYFPVSCSERLLVLLPVVQQALAVFLFGAYFYIRTAHSNVFCIHSCATHKNKLSEQQINSGRLRFHHTRNDWYRLFEYFLLQMGLYRFFSYSFHYIFIAHFQVSCFRSTSICMKPRW